MGLFRKFSASCILATVAAAVLAWAVTAAFSGGQGGGALASFNEITVTEMTIRISSKYTTMSEDLFDEDNYAIHVSEIYVTGKEA